MEWTRRRLEKVIDRVIATYKEKGYAEAWINQKIITFKIWKELTIKWQEREILQEKDYAILTKFKI